MLQGRATAEEAAQVKAWRLERAEHAEVYERLRHRLSMLRYFYEELEPGPAPDAQDLIWRAELRRRPAPATSSTRFRRWTARAAATAAVLAAGFALAELRPGEGPGEAFGVEAFVTGEGETVTLTLRDGSVVRLAPHSRLWVAAADGRVVTLAGRAYFAVAYREGEPFRVRTDAGEVTVLGTRFDLQAETDELRVVVAEGRVVLSGESGEVEVRGGQMSGVREGEHLAVVSVPDARRLSGWVGDFLAFQDTPLRDVAREIEAQYGTRFRFTDPSLADRVVTAWFVDRTLEEVVQVVCLVATATCTIRDGEVVMAPAAASGDGGSRVPPPEVDSTEGVCDACEPAR